MLERRLEPIIRQALDDFRVVVISGPRQAGKTTLVRRVLDGAGTFARLDRAATLQAALADPDGFATFGETPRAFDEVQRAGDPLIRAIKDTVDDDASRGQFLLNGSADFLTVPTISESLAGRAALLELWPFTQGEIHQTPDGFIDAAFSDPDRLLGGGASPLVTGDYLERACAGGFPEAVSMPPAARHTWFRDYLRTVIQRDIKDLSGARRTQDLPKLLKLLAARTAGELVVKNLHDDTGFGSRHTTEAYLGYLLMTYLVVLLPAWSRNLTSKAARRPKVHIVDSGLAAHVLGTSPQALARPTDPARGQIIETFAVNEMYRQASWHHGAITLHHFRDRGGAEIDVVAEAADGRLVAVEIKSGPAVDRSDARHLRRLRDKAPEDFICGVVLHTGERAYRLDDRILALPMSHLWTAS